MLITYLWFCWQFDEDLLMDELLYGRISKQDDEEDEKNKSEGELTKQPCHDWIHFNHLLYFTL